MTIKRIQSFTIFEATIVLTIMSILVVIVSMSINRFNEQLYFANQTNAELNHIHLVRSTIWNDLYSANSIKFENENLKINSKSNLIIYKIENDSLFRKKDEWINLNVRASSIDKTTIDKTSVFNISLPWKNSELNIEYFFKPSIEHNVNSYFENL